MEILPYGAWRSPITSDLIVAEAIGLGGVLVDGTDIYWTESRPGEGGRSVIVRSLAGGGHTDLTPPPYNVRGRVHEYGRRFGGGCIAASRILATLLISGSTDWLTASRRH